VPRTVAVFDRRPDLDGDREGGATAPFGAARLLLDTVGLLCVGRPGDGDLGIVALLVGWGENGGGVSCVDNDMVAAYQRWRDGAERFYTSRSTMLQRRKEY
jgi:hypothetical protein